MPHPPDLSPDSFKQLGHQLVDALADFYATMPQGKVTPAESPAAVQAALPAGALPLTGTDPATLLRQATDLVTTRSLHNGHPRFWGYITSSAAPLGALADLLAAAVNPNVGSFQLGPVATEIERQSVRWIGELTGFATGSDGEAHGLFVSGGNMANFVCLLAARARKAQHDVRKLGLAAAKKPPVLYASRETHTWLEKAADLFGFGTESVRFLPVDKQLRLIPEALTAAIAEDERAGRAPLLVVVNAGTVSTGAVDPIRAIAPIAKQHGLWLHADGAYGGFGGLLPEAPDDLRALSLCDSLAVDPHKWLYAPLEAGCALVKDPAALLDAFSYRPPYYHFDPSSSGTVNFFEHGLQNSRGFRALKVWLGLRHLGRQGYEAAIRADAALARRLYDRASAHPDLEVGTHNLSITTLRYKSVDKQDDTNQRLLSALNKSGEAYLSNAVIDGAFFLRACIVNFRTTNADIDALPDLIARVGKSLS